jgi:hypothetical protein
MQCPPLPLSARIREVSDDIIVSKKGNWLKLPTDSPFGWDDQPPTGVVSSGPCDLCFIKTLQKQAESPYYDGPALRRSSVYEWKTKSCGISNQPLMILTLPFSP